MLVARAKGRPKAPPSPPTLPTLPPPMGSWLPKLNSGGAAVLPVAPEPTRPNGDRGGFAEAPPRLTELPNAPPPALAWTLRETSRAGASPPKLRSAAAAMTPCELDTITYVPSPRALSAPVREIEQRRVQRLEGHVGKDVHRRNGVHARARRTGSDPIRDAAANKGVRVGRGCGSGKVRLGGLLRVRHRVVVLLLVEFGDVREDVRGRRVGDGAWLGVRRGGARVRAGGVRASCRSRRPGRGRGGCRGICAGASFSRSSRRVRSPSGSSSGCRRR